MERTTWNLHLHSQTGESICERSAPGVPPSSQSRTVPAFGVSVRTLSSGQRDLGICSLADPGFLDAVRVDVVDDIVCA